MDLSASPPQPRNLNQAQFKPIPAQPAPSRQTPPDRKWQTPPKWETNYLVAPLSMQETLQTEGIPAPTGRGFETFYARSHAVRGAGGVAQSVGLPQREMGIYPVQVDRRLQDPKRHPQQAGWERRLPVYNSGSLGPARVGDPTPHPSGKR